MAAHDIRDVKNQNWTFNNTQGWMTHKYLTKRSSHLSINSLRENKPIRWEKTETKGLQKHLGNLKKTWGYFTVASCTPMTRSRAHASNITRGKPVGQDTSSYSTWHSDIVWCELYQTFRAHEEVIDHFTTILMFLQKEGRGLGSHF